MALPHRHRRPVCEDGFEDCPGSGLLHPYRQAGRADVFRTVGIGPGRNGHRFSLPLLVTIELDDRTISGGFVAVFILIGGIVGQFISIEFALSGKIVKQMVVPE
ncbi:MAG: hypothetical protein BWY31_04800 [Lentisphaerae bacterium ADurb.Bin242]|nr:MAG: hypothetical protein BWY31_04800 [Lentisphaerae bacterium ADurb.Bin242]